eukprot:8914249-Lingulodinium_polyedra.AAC.1
MPRARCASAQQGIRPSDNTPQLDAGAWHATKSETGGALLAQPQNSRFITSTSTPLLARSCMANSPSMSLCAYCRITLGPPG